MLSPYSVPYALIQNCHMIFGCLFRSHTKLCRVRLLGRLPSWSSFFFSLPTSLPPCLFLPLSLPLFISFLPVLDSLKELGKLSHRIAPILDISVASQLIYSIDIYISCTRVSSKDLVRSRSSLTFGLGWVDRNTLIHEAVPLCWTTSRSMWCLLGIFFGDSCSARIGQCQQPSLSMEPFPFLLWFNCCQLFLNQFYHSASVG